MTDWQRVKDADFAVPDDKPLADLVAELTGNLRSPDPVLRDEQSYYVLATWVEKGVLDGDLERLGDEMAALLDDPEVQARTFATLILGEIVDRGTYFPRWLDAFANWYPSEVDLRGHDEKLGWLHAVAHGADTLKAFGGHTDVDPARMLSIAAQRLLAPTEFVWRDQEDDRLAFAVAHVLTRPELTEADSVGWLAAVDTDFTSGEPGPPPPHASNTMRTLRLLYILADRGVRPSWRGGDVTQLQHRDAVKQRLAEVLARVAPFTG
ncbi:DUF2785 domain-containing protein [Stackebrandtia nassauensis]|uniref:DUF2785 domain-containing protein n=1 Tax=Stackebrandtia nassauensis (strain DSM 44728 / CIP 108903 / NRRL B-16338 / NBRC 102104 / LLR-40K-21) TaxID=446470 RepID=D3PZI5_STANL|nr:DUF2785 domain-containing protein [Stackebrandtia nassauensis]ADD41659.1 hypothetical protein Snas_1963 [Stackebrandtia nassauensis DSM 44728]